MQHSGAADGHVSPAVSKDSRASKHKRSSVDALDQTAGAGADQQPQRGTVGRSRALLWNDGSTLLVDRARSPFVAQAALSARLLLLCSASGYVLEVSVGPRLPCLTRFSGVSCRT